MRSFSSRANSITRRKPEVEVSCCDRGKAGPVPTDWLTFNLSAAAEKPPTSSGPMYTK
jgi:hypothetical protein